MLQLNIDMQDVDDVSKVIILWSKRCLVLQKNNKEWELPGGHLNLGETYKQGAIREVREETGIKLGKLKTIIKQKQFRMFVSPAKVIKVKLSDEHINYKWVNRREFIKLKLTKSTLINLKSILNWI